MSTTQSFSEGNRVLFIGSPEYYSGDYSFRRVKQEKIYGIVLGSNERKVYFMTAGNELVSFSHYSSFLNPKNAVFAIQKKDLVLIPENEYKMYEELHLAHEEQIKQEKQALRNSVFQPSKESYMNRTFLFEDKQKLNTNHNYAVLGKLLKIDSETTVFEGRYKNFRPQCCAFTKATEDVDVYIPEIWLNYYGYTAYDLVEWCKFLKKCEFGFDFEFHGLGQLHTLFEGDANNQQGFVEDYQIDNLASVIYPKGMDGFYRVILKGDASYKMHTYMRFICLRYIYNHAYWTIPGHAMQIKKALGATVTHWQALLLAHLHRPFFGYYNLVSQHDYDPGKKRLSPEDPEVSNIFAIGMNYDRHVNPFQKPETIVSKLKSTDKMNPTFEYFTNILKREELNKFFDNKDYVGLYKYVLLATKAKNK